MNATKSEATAQDDIRAAGDSTAAPADVPAARPENPQAFPSVEYMRDCGMTLRDWFAALAVQGFCTGINGEWIMSRGDPGNAFDRMAERAFVMADAMLAQRSKQP